MLFFGNLLKSLFFVIIAFVIPGGLTIWNIYNLFSKKSRKVRLASWLTIVIGGIFYMLLYAIAFDPAGDWYEPIYIFQTHYSISSQYVLSIALPTLIGFIGLIILFNVKSDKLPPLVSALSIASVVILNIIQIVYAVQISENIIRTSVEGMDILLYVYHLNIFILSVTAVRNQIRQQLEIYKSLDENNQSTGKGIGWLYGKIKNISNYTVLIFICLFFLIAILEIIFILLGQGADAPIKAFTDTADWTFSKQLPPPPLKYEGHYLCTVAAGGHKKIVKPLRCGVYDKYGYPISKHITTPYQADLVYIVMKPLEWLFLIFLYLFDIRPEQRISRQYAYRND